MFSIIPTGTGQDILKSGGIGQGFAGRIKLPFDDDY